MAVRIVAPGGMLTRTDDPPPVPHAVAAASAAMDSTREQRIENARRVRSTTLQRMLEKDGRRERVDVAFALARRAAHLANRAQRRGGAVSLVDQLHRQACPL